MSVELSEQDDTGFAAALRAAIAARGLSLDRLREHLARRGATVSLATLSYWQTGRSQPERQSSLAALAHLEQILRVDPGELAAHLRPPVRRRTRQRPAIGALWPRPGQVEDLTGEVDTAWDERLTRISQHDLITVSRDGGERAYRSRQVLRAEADGPDRWVAIVHLDEHDRPLPRVRPRRGCGLGRVVARPETGLLVAELLFDAPLRRGDTVVTEHELVNHRPYPADGNYERKFRLPVREYVLEVCFDPAALPAACERYTRDADGRERVRRVAVPPTGTVHGVALDFGPGCFGFRWRW